MSATPVWRPVGTQREGYRAGRLPAARVQFVCALLATLLLASHAQARTETLTWNHPDPPPAEGFRVYQGASPGAYGAPLDIGLPIPDGSGVYSYDLIVPDNDTVYVAITAYAYGLESPYSNEQLRAPGGPPPNQAPDGTLDAPGGAVTIEAGQSVSFAGTGSDPDANVPLSYAWDFGASGVAASTLEDPGALAFANPGSFTVTFTVSDALGLADPTPASVVVTVNPPPPPQAPNGTIDVPSSAVVIETGQSVSFAGTGTDPDGNLPLSFLWDFGGSGVSASSAEDPGSRTFASVGVFTVTFTVTDDLGISDPTPDTVTVTVNAPPANQAPQGSIVSPAAPTTIEVGQSVSFAGTGTDADGDLPLTYFWDFGPSGVAASTLEDPGAVTFGVTGTFNVTFAVTDARGLADPTPATVAVTVELPPQPPNGTIDSPAGPVTIETGQSVSFQGTGTDPDGDLPLTYQWSFGGSGVAPSSSEDPGSLTFASAGTFNVTFTVTDDLGMVDPTPDSVSVTVQDPPPPGSGADVAAAAGIVYTQYQVTTPPSSDDAVYLTGGVAAGDYDADGAVDLYVTRLDAPDILFRNDGDGTFSDVTAAAGLDLALASNGASWADVDNDGDLDLYVTTLGATANGFALFINDGSGSFSEEAFLRGAAVAGPDAHYGFSVAVGDYDLDGWLDLHTTEWRPDAQNPGAALANARLLRNRGAGAPGFFEDVTSAAGVALDNVPIAVPGVAGTFALTSRFANMDTDGWPDLLVTSDFGSSRLFWNNGNGTFSDGTTAAGVGTDDSAAGSAVGDYDGDGDLDWFVTGIYDPADPCAAPGATCVWQATGNRLYRNEGNRSFSDQTDAAGVRDGYWGAAAAFFELDNDGDLDLIMTNGANVPHLSPGDAAAYARFTADPLRLWENDGAGGMTEVSATHGWTDTGAGRGLATFDYDNDGDLDVFIANQAAGPVLYRNDAATGNSWIRVKTVGTDSNRDGVGALVSVWTDAVGPPQVREISAGSHYLGQSEMTAHFGLGAGSSPLSRVSVYWPMTQRTNDFFDVARNSVLVATEPPAPPAGGSGGGVTPTAGGGGGAGPDSTSFFCGLIGIEPFLVLPLARLLVRRSRKRIR